jgi:hypothetical protein
MARTPSRPLHALPCRLASGLRPASGPRRDARFNLHVTLRLVLNLRPSSLVKVVYRMGTALEMDTIERGHVVPLSFSLRTAVPRGIIPRRISCGAINAVHTHTVWVNVPSILRQGRAVAVCICRSSAIGSLTWT